RARVSARQPPALGEGLDGVEPPVDYEEPDEREPRRHDEAGDDEEGEAHGDERAPEHVREDDLTVVVAKGREELTDLGRASAYRAELGVQGTERDWRDDEREVDGREERCATVARDRGRARDDAPHERQQEQRKEPSLQNLPRFDVRFGCRRYAVQGV